jgi:hypothetical protein
MYYRSLQFFFFFSSLRNYSRVSRRGHFCCLYSLYSNAFSPRLKSIDSFEQKSPKLALYKAFSLAVVNAAELLSSTASAAKGNLFFVFLVQKGFQPFNQVACLL